MNADGTGIRPLTQHEGDDYNPAWSPAGDRIAFESVRPGSSLRAIYTIDPDGGHEAKLTSGRSNDLFPSWSPDGKRIVYCSVWNRRATLAVMNGDGSAPRTLEQGCSPSWAPSGNRIAFVADGGTAVYIMSLYGRTRIRVTRR
jgi:TolB protein